MPWVFPPKGGKEANVYFSFCLISFLLYLGGLKAAPHQFKLTKIQLGLRGKEQEGRNFLYPSTKRRNVNFLGMARSPVTLTLPRDHSLLLKYTKHTPHLGILFELILLPGKLSPSPISHFRKLWLSKSSAQITPLPPTHLFHNILCIIFSTYDYKVAYRVKCFVTVTLTINPICIPSP